MSPTCVSVEILPVLGLVWWYTACHLSTGEGGSIGWRQDSLNYLVRPSLTITKRNDRIVQQIKVQVFKPNGLSLSYNLGTHCFLTSTRGCGTLTQKQKNEEDKGPIHSYLQYLHCEVKSKQDVIMSSTKR